MKALRTLLTGITFGLLIAFSGCGPKGGGTETIQDKQIGLLTNNSSSTGKTWKISSVSGPNGDATSDWQSFTLTLTGTKGQSSINYLWSGIPSTGGPWPKTQYAFTFDTTTPATLVVRTPDQLPITYSATSTTLTLSFTYPSGGTIYSRNENLGGSWQFNLIPQ